MPDRHLIIFALNLIVVLLTSNDWVLKLGDNAPSFSLKGTEGKEYTLTDFKNKKAILIIFMCNHCPYVKPQIENIKKIASKWKDKVIII